MEISVSLLKESNIDEAIEKLNTTNASYFHLDVMDGNFVSNTSYSISQIKNMIKKCNKKIDAHFMVNDPIYYLDKLKEEKIENFTFHVELDDVESIINKVKECNFKVGLAIKPNTNINVLNRYLDKIDLILVMSVEPGYGGQKFLPSTISRLNDIKSLIGNRNIKLAVDGGINDDTIKLISNIDIAVVGSYITNNQDYQEQLNKLLN